MFNGVAMCCRDVVATLWNMLDFELLSQCSMTWPCVVEM